MEPQDDPKELEDPAKAFWGDKWFAPILDELGKFQIATKHLFCGAEEVLEDDAPDWSLLSAWTVGQSWTDYTGFDLPQNWDARQVGKMMGAEWSICAAYAKSHKVWSNLNPEEIRKRDGVFFPGFCSKCAELTRQFSEKWTPLFREIRRKAMDLALTKAGSDELDYVQGYGQGQMFMQKVREKMRSPRHKREQDEQARNCVFLFAMCCGRAIEMEKGELSWPELHQLFRESFDYKVEIDEEAFKKILSRMGLRGVGKAGRPPSNEIVTPKIPRRP